MHKVSKDEKTTQTKKHCSFSVVASLISIICLAIIMTMQPLLRFQAKLLARRRQKHVRWIPLVTSLHLPVTQHRSFSRYSSSSRISITTKSTTVSLSVAPAPAAPAPPRGREITQGIWARAMTTSNHDNLSSDEKDELFRLETKLQKLEDEITLANNGKSVNMASNKQVSMALFGTPNQSTAKAALEGMAVSNSLAKLIIQYRETKFLVNKLSKLAQEREERQKKQVVASETTAVSEDIVANLNTKTTDTEPPMLVDASSPPDDLSSTTPSTLSADEFRAKYTTNDNSNDNSLLPLPTTIPMVEASRRQDNLFQLETNLQKLEEDITIANNGKSINIASNKQVSMALFGIPNESTAKTVLEGMAVSNILAKLILQYREMKYQYNRLSKLEQEKEERQKKQIVASEATTVVADVVEKRKTTVPSRSNTDTEPLMLLDTSSFIFRAYHSIPPRHRSIDGMPTNAIFGFCSMLNRIVMPLLIAGKQPRLVLCCDAPSPPSGGPKTMRHELYPEYKAHRQEMPMDLIPQIPFIQKAAQVYGIQWVEAPGYEADDVIASLTQKAAIEEGLMVHIYSGDKDLMQLITNSSDIGNGIGSVIMIDSMKGMKHFDHDSVLEKWGVPAHQLSDVLALAGDTADNIPGVPGIGPVMGAELIQTFNSVEELYQNLDLVTQKKRREKLETYRDQAFLSKALVQLERNLDWEAMLILDGPSDGTPSVEGTSAASLPPPERVADMRMAKLHPDRILRFYDEMGFVTMKQRLLEQLDLKEIDYSYGISNGSTNSKKVGGNKWKRGNSAPTKVTIPKPEDYASVPF